MKDYEGAKRGKAKVEDELMTYLFLNRGRGIPGQVLNPLCDWQKSKLKSLGYRLVSLTSCVALDYFFVVYTFRFYVASKNVAFKTQLLTPPLLCTQMVFNKSFEEVMGLKSFSTNG